MRGERLLPVLTAGGLLASWAALSTRYPPVLLPSPAEVTLAAIAGAETLLEATTTTAMSSLSGLLLAVGTGLLGAMLFSRSRWIEAALYPYALLIQTVPIVAIAPLLVVWLGYGSPPAIASAAIVSFFPVLTAANLGLRSTPREQVELFALYDAGFLRTLLAVGTGLLGAMLFSRSRWIEAALYPYALLIQTVPIVAIAPLLVVWLGYGSPPAIASAAIVSFFPVLTAANLGLRSTPREQVELFALYDAGFLRTLLHLRLPGALPFLFSGLRTAAGLSVIGAIVGEFVGSNGLPPSLGFVVLRSARSADTATSFAAIFAAAALALAFFSAVRLLEKFSIGRWHGGE